MTDLCVVERLKEYYDLDGFEADLITEEDKKIAVDWPQNGDIEFKNVSLRYRQGLPLVIKNLNLRIEAGQKVAIVGRTGSGKSTLILSLLRILEILDDTQENGSRNKGLIEVDGVDISKLGLTNLRSSIFVIPQDPFLTQGSLRFNLDQLGVYSNEEIIEASKRINLFSVLNLESKQYTEDDKKTVLDFEIEGNGDNLSLGQKQLIYIAKAILQKPKILLMDEATASVDKKQDKLIQEAILSNIKGCTTITVAHRLHSILDYDKVVVIDDGTKVEEGSIQQVYDKRELFYQMMREANITL